MNKILIGTDPELFVRVNGQFISSHTLMPGTKEEPFPVPGGAIQVDGVSAEFNIIPAESLSEYIENISSVRSAMLGIIREAEPEAELVAIPTAWFDREYFDSLPDTPKLLGCTPDFNAYTRQPNAPPSTDKPFRTGSGHQHIGWTSDVNPYEKDHFLLCCDLVKELDNTLYPLTLTYDTDEQRRSLYGAPGAFRPKSYGLEYRAISNAFLKDDETIELVYRTVFDVATSFLSRRGLAVAA